MKTLALIPLLLMSLTGGPAVAAECPPILNVEMKPLRGGEAVNFCNAYKGKVILAVNTASQCGFTPQFKGLEALYKEYGPRGLMVLAFPSNDFKQEFSDAEKTAGICYLNYGVSFPVFAKTAVTGAEANPFFKSLAQQSGVEPQWNFHKYLISRDGRVAKAFPSRVTPEDAGLRHDIEALLDESSAGSK
ncbi:MAG: glutathione peroxidase [Methylococcaceae bacterium]|jgi:glutathione peroxidase